MSIHETILKDILDKDYGYQSTVTISLDEYMDLMVVKAEAGRLRENNKALVDVISILEKNLAKKSGTEEE